MNRVILHLDMNSYFASVEQQANPLLRDKPIGVCAYLTPNGCILASSMEAKHFGVKTGMRARDAQKLCPHIILLENEPAKYRSVTEKIFSILGDYSDRIEHYSIDEAFLDLTGWALTFTAAEIIAQKIKQRITAEVGEWLKCSIGISYTRWLAKFASDIAAKNSVLILTPDKLEAAFTSVKLTDAWGIGKRIERRLRRLGIRNLNELKKYPVGNLMHVLGKYGYYLWANVNGLEIERVKTSEHTKPKSFGHQYSLARRTTDPVFLKGVLMKLCEKTGRRLRSHQLEAHGISVYMSFVSGGGRHLTRHLVEPLFTTASIFDVTKTLLLTDPLPDRVRLLAITVHSLRPLSFQTNLFTNTLKQKNIALAMDKINDIYGDFTITSGEMAGMERFVQDRIGFRKVEL